VTNTTRLAFVGSVCLLFCTPLRAQLVHATPTARQQFILDVRAKLDSSGESDDISVEARGDGSRTIRYRIGIADFRAGMPQASDAVRVLVNADGPLSKAIIQRLGFQVIEFEDGKGVVRRFRIADIVPR